MKKWARRSDDIKRWTAALATVCVVLVIVAAYFDASKSPLEALGLVTPTVTQPTTKALPTSTPRTAPKPVATAVGGAAPPTPSSTADSRIDTAAVGPANSLRTATVQRGTVNQELVVNGRVAGVDEQGLDLSVGGKVASVSVKPGDVVHSGQTLLELDAQPLLAQINATKASIETASLQLQQAQQAVAQRDQTAAAAQQDRVQQSEADLARAEAALDRLTAPPPDAALNAANLQVTKAGLTLQQAQATLATLERGADPNDVSDAEHAATLAQRTLDSAKADLDQLRAGANPDSIRAAERAVTLADLSLKSAQAASVDPTDKSGASAPAHQAAIIQANASLQDAKDNLARLKAGPTEQQLKDAQAKVSDAQFAFTRAQQHYQELKSGPARLALDNAQAAVTAAQLALTDAQSNAAQLQSGPPPDQLATATAAVDAATAALAKARSTAPTSGTNYDVELLQKNLERDQTTLQTLQKQLDSMQVRAPYDGVVKAVNVEAAATVDANQVVLSVARSGDPIVIAPVPAASLAGVAPDLQASVQLDGGDGTTFAGTVAELVPAADGSGSTVGHIAVTWSKQAPPTSGATARVAIVVQTKQDVLVVPRQSVRLAGDRTYVEIVDGQTLRNADVQIGIVSETGVEIVSGLQEGQVVVAGVAAITPTVTTVARS